MDIVNEQLLEDLYEGDWFQHVRFHVETIHLPTRLLISVPSQNPCIFPSSDFLY